MGWNYIPDPPNQNQYIYPPPSYPPPAPMPPPGVSKSDWKEYVKFAKAMAKGVEPKKKEEKKEEKKGLKKITEQNYSLAVVILWLIILGPVVGPLYNRFEALILKLVNGN